MEPTTKRSNQDSPADAPRSTLFLGWNGCGKTYTIDMLLRAGYGAERGVTPYGPPPLYAKTTTLPEAMNSDFETVYVAPMFRVENLGPTEEKGRDWLKRTFSGKGQFDSHRFHPPSLVLESAGPNSMRTTTAHMTKIRYARTWEIRVKYLSKQQIVDMINEHNLPRTEAMMRQGSVWAIDGGSQRHLYIIEMLRSVTQDASLPRPPRVMDDDEYTLYPDEFVDDLPQVLPFPKPGQPITFTALANQCCGKTFVYTTEGKDALADRLYVRRALHGLTNYGIGTNGKFPAEPGTPGSEESYPESNNTKHYPDLNLIEYVEVLGPIEFLKDGLVLIDAPGLGDCNPVNYKTTIDAMKACTNVLMLGERGPSANLSMTNAFIDYIVPRMFDTDPYHRVAGVAYGFKHERMNMGREDLSSSDRQAEFEKCVYNPLYEEIKHVARAFKSQGIPFWKEGIAETCNRFKQNIFADYPTYWVSAMMNDATDTDSAHAAFVFKCGRALLRSVLANETRFEAVPVTDVPETVDSERFFQIARAVTTKRPEMCCTSSFGIETVSAATNTFDHPFVRACAESVVHDSYSKFIGKWFKTATERMTVLSMKDASDWIEKRFKENLEAFLGAWPGLLREKMDTAEKVVFKIADAKGKSVEEWESEFRKNLKGE